MATSDDPGRVAITDTTGRAITRDELRRVSAAVAVRLAEENVDALGYLAPNHVAFAMCVFGAAGAGVPFVPLNYRLSDEQLADLVSRHHNMLLVTDAAGVERAAAFGAAGVIDRDVLVADALAVGEVELPKPGDSDDIAVLLYTSGTSSAPKAAVLRHRHLTSYVFNSVDFGSASSEDAVLVSVPPYHIAGVSNLLSNLYSGRRIVYLDPFDPHRWLELVEAERISHAMVVPTMLARIVEALGEEQGPRLPSLAYGGSTMPQPVLERALRLFPDTAFTNAYGLTETSSTITVFGPEDHRAAFGSNTSAARRRLASVGRPLPGVEIEVRDEEGSAVPAGSVGAVYVRGEQVSGEYVGLSSSVDDDGWFPTRDIGFVDEDGYLFVEGRADDTIIRGGENIAPAEIEDVLLRHHAIAECAVVGVSDDEWGQRIAAVVVPRTGIAVDEDEVRSFAQRHLRSSKTPDLVVVWDELPYTATGKLLRRAVRSALEAPGSNASTVEV